MNDAQGYPVFHYRSPGIPIEIRKNDKRWNKDERVGCELLWLKIKNIDYAKKAAKERTFGYKFKWFLCQTISLVLGAIVWAVVIGLLCQNGCEGNPNGSREYEQFEYLY